MSSNTETNAANHQSESEIKQDLDEDLSRLVRKYESRGLNADEIVDSVLWHAEVAMSRSPGDEPADVHDLSEL